MATVPPPPRELKFGNIVDKTIAVVDRCIRPALVYLVILTVVSATITYFSPATAPPLSQLVGALLKWVIGVIAAYFLIEAMLRATGLGTRPGGDSFVPFLALSALYTLGLILGFIAIILPGFIIMARWMIAQPLLIARRDGPRRALGQSWELTKGNELQILGALLAMLILPIAIVIACSVFFEKTDVVGIVVSQLASSAMSVIAAAMGVALYALIVVARSAASFE